MYKNRKDNLRQLDARAMLLVPFLAVAFFFSCNMSLLEKKSAVGQLSISVQRLASWAQGEDTDVSRAFCRADRVVVTAYNASGAKAGEVVSQPLAGANNTITINMELQEGSGYRIVAAIYNNAVSTDNPVVVGEKAGVTIRPGTTNTLTVVCLPVNATKLSFDTNPDSTSKAATLVADGEHWFSLAVGLNRKYTFWVEPTAATSLALFNGEGTLVKKFDTHGSMEYIAGKAGTIYLGLSAKTADTYMVGVDRVSNNADLESLTPNAGAIWLEETNATGEKGYIIAVPSATTTLEVTAVKKDADATMNPSNGILTFTDAEFSDRSEAQSFAKKKTITVTAQDGITRKNYNVVALKLGETDLIIKGNVQDLSLPDGSYNLMCKVTGTPDFSNQTGGLINLKGGKASFVFVSAGKPANGEINLKFYVKYAENMYDYAAGDWYADMQIIYSGESLLSFGAISGWRQ